MLVGGRRDAKPRTGINVDMRIHAALADELQAGQALQERRPDRGAFADQHQRFGVGKAGRECIDILDVVVPDGDLMAVELAEARQRAHGVMVVIQDGDLHEICAPSAFGWGFVGNKLESRLDMQCGGNAMQKLIIAIAATVALSVLPISATAAADAQGVRHHRAGHHAGSYYGPYVTANPAVRGGYVMNGAFDWRPLHSGHEIPWYAHGYTHHSAPCTLSPYHSPSDPNNRHH